MAAGSSSWSDGRRLGRVFFVVLFVADNVEPVRCLVHLAGVVSGFLYLPWCLSGVCQVLVVGFEQILGFGLSHGSSLVVVCLLPVIVGVMGGGIGGF